MQHAELELGQSAIFLGQKPPNTLNSFGMYVGVDEPELDALYARLEKRGEPPCRSCHEFSSSPTSQKLSVSLQSYDGASTRARTGLAFYSTCACHMTVCWTRAGAKFSKPMFTTPYNTREFDVQDLESNIWTFGTYR